MSVKITYKCDKCGAESESDDQFWIVSVSAQVYKYRQSLSAPQKSIQICRKCLDSFGIIIKPKDPVEAAKFPTIEDLIVEIVQRTAKEGM